MLRIGAISRRRFLQAGMASLAAAGVAGMRLEARAEEAAASRFPAGRYVDVHTHLGVVWNGGKELTAEGLLEWMDAHEIAQSVVLPLTSPESSSYLITTEATLAATKPHRDRLIPFCALDPRTSYSGGLDGLVGMLARWQEQGARGFGEHKPGVTFDHPLNMRIYEACGRLGLPVLFHLDNQRNMDKPGLPGLERALKEFPHTNFIGHGPGWWASISGNATQAELGGYPGSAVTEGGAIDVLMEKYDNLYGDLSAGSGNQALQRDMKFAREFMIRRADRLMFGTDYLAPGQGVPQFVTLRLLELPEEVETKVYRDNARRLLFSEA